MQKITPFLWFDGNAEEAMNHYVSIFKDAKIVNISRYREGDRQGQVISGTFELEGQRFMAIDGGPQYKFTPAISLYVNCVTQDEVDELWEKLTEGGEPGRCGWLIDKFGVSWQIIPAVLGQLMGDPDRHKAGRVVNEMLKMDKIDIARLKEAYEGKPD